MQYILALGLAFKKYKKPLNVLVSSNQMIDYLTIEEDIKDKKIGIPKEYRVEGMPPLHEWSTPEKMFFYEIDETAIGDKFIFNIDCEDNNYNNGFMTRTSLVQFRHAFILPKPLLDWYYKNENTQRIKDLKFNRFDNPYKIKPKIGTNIFDSNCWPYQRRNWHWTYYNSQQTTEFEALNYGKVSTQFFDFNPAWIGGKFKVEIEVLCKHGVKMFNPYIDQHKKCGQIWTNLFLFEKSLKQYYKLNITNEDQ